MWVPPGKSANPNLWRYDLAGKSFLPPGTEASLKGTQVEMPDNFDDQAPRGFHMVASPAGTQAPIEHINYTPDTGEVHGRGTMAPPHLLNYTLLPDAGLHAGASQGPSSAMGTGQTNDDARAAQTQYAWGTTPLSGALRGYMGGHRQEVDFPETTDEPNPYILPIMGRGHITPGAMGAGAAVPSLNAFGAPQPFAGTPPLAGSPTMTGPSPTTNQAAPQWGGGGTPFDTRMGMGADDDDIYGQTDPTKPPAGQAAPATAAPAAQGATPAATDYDPTAVPLNLQGQPAKPGDPISVLKDENGNIILYTIFESMGEFGISPKVHYQAGNSPKAKDPQIIQNKDGSIDVIDLTKKPGEQFTRIQHPDPNLVAAAARADDIQKLNLQVAQANAAVAQATSANAAAEAQAKLQILQVQLQQAQVNLNEAMVKASMAGKPTPAAKPATIVGADRHIYALNPDTDKYDDTGLISPSESGDWEKYTNPLTGTIHLYNKATREDVTLGPVDPYKEYPPEKGSNGKWIQWDPAKQTYRKVYQDDPEWDTQWANDELIAINKNDKTQVKVIWKKKPTQAEDDAHDAAIDAHNTALIGAEKELQTLLHPKPQMLSQGSFMVPPGLDVDIEDIDPWTGATSHRRASGGPRDPRIDALIAKIDAMTRNGPGTRTADTATTATSTSTSGGTSGGTAAGTTGTSVGAQMGGRDVRPGYPGYDPEHLGGSAQPPTRRTTASGDIAEYDAQGNLTGIRYLNTAPPGYTEEQVTEAAPADEAPAADEYFDEAGRRRDDVGFGNEGRMGAGMAAGTTGWAPRPGIFAPATGPGFLGAGAEPEQQFYDKDGNPILAALQRALGKTTTLPRLPTGGHTPPIDLKIPGPGPANKGEVKPPGPAINVAPKPDKGVTDEGANWKPDLKGVVTQRVNEPLGEINKWPKLEHTEPTDQPLIGTEGGFDQPEIDPVDLQTKERFPPEYPTDAANNPPWVKDLSHLAGIGGTTPEAWQGMAEEQGVGRHTDPDVQRILDELRQKYGTLGVGQEPGDTMPSPGGAPGIPPQGPGGEQPPQWLLTLLRNHPELLQMAGASGPPSGGSPPPPAPPAAAAGAPPTPGQSAGGPPPTAPSAGWAPPPPQGAAPPGAPPTGGPPPGGPPTAPSPEGAPMTPPLDPQDVAGIGHRFGQPMNVGEPQHSGVDLQAPEGTPTKSPVDGFVLRVEDNPQGLGITVIIKGMDGSEHRLGHLKDTSAYAGMQVKMGQDLGSPVGETGMTTGAHLHWGVRDGQGQPADPTAALGPMAQMPPVPGTEMMGPPGGVGGGAQQGAPQMGGGQAEYGDPWKYGGSLPQIYTRHNYPGGKTPGADVGAAKDITLNPMAYAEFMAGLKGRDVLGTGAEGWAGGPEFGSWFRHMPDAMMPFNGGHTSAGAIGVGPGDFPPGAMQSYYGALEPHALKIDPSKAFGTGADDGEGRYRMHQNDDGSFEANVGRPDPTRPGWGTDVSNIHADTGRGWGPDYVGGSQQAEWDAPVNPQGLPRDRTSIDRKQGFGPNADIYDPSQGPKGHQPGIDVPIAKPNIFTPPAPGRPNIFTPPPPATGGHVPGPEIRTPDWLSSKTSSPGPGPDPQDPLYRDAVRELRNEMQGRGNANQPGRKEQFEWGMQQPDILAEQYSKLDTGQPLPPGSSGTPGLSEQHRDDWRRDAAQMQELHGGTQRPVEQTSRRGRMVSNPDWSQTVSMSDEADPRAFTRMMQERENLGSLGTGADTPADPLLDWYRDTLRGRGWNPGQQEFNPQDLTGDTPTTEHGTQGGFRSFDQNWRLHGDEGPGHLMGGEREDLGNRGGIENLPTQPNLPQNYQDIKNTRGIFDDRPGEPLDAYGERDSAMREMLDYRRQMGSLGTSSTPYDPSQGPKGHVPGWDVPGSPGHNANPGEIRGPGPSINTGPGPIVSGGHTPGPELQMPDWLSSRVKDFDPRNFFPGGQNTIGGAASPGGEQNAYPGDPNIHDVKQSRPFGTPEDMQEMRGRFTTGVGQDSKGKKGKRKKAGWQPKQGMGAGIGYPPDPNMPGYSTDWTANHAAGLNRRRLGGYTGGMAGSHPTGLVSDATERLPSVKINPMEAFGTGQEQGGGDSMGALRNALQQEWQRMTSGGSGMGMGAGERDDPFAQPLQRRMSPAGGMFGGQGGVPQLPQTMRGAAPGRQTPSAPSGGQSIGQQMAAFGQPQQGGQFGRAGQMPLGRPMPQMQPLRGGEQLPATAGQP